MIEKRTIQREVEEVVEVIKAKVMKDVDVFVTTDGEEFYHQREAESHQARLDKIKMRNDLQLKLRAITIGEYDIAYIVNSEDANEYYVGEAYYYPIRIDKKDLPNWFKVEFSDGGDYKSSYYVEKLDDVLIQMMDEYNTIVEHIKGDFNKEVRI